MKKNVKRVESFLAKAALAVTKANANSTCPFITHQPKLPEKAKNLRKF